MKILIALLILCPLALAQPVVNPYPPATHLVPGSSGGGAPTGAAGGDLGGTYPNPTVTAGSHLASGSTVVAQKFFVTAAPGSIAGNLPGDTATDTTNHLQYVCNAPSGTAAPACASVTAAGWLCTTALREISFVLCANLNCSIGDSITVPRNISAATAGTLQKCSVRFGTSPSATTSIDVRKNGSGSALATISASAATANTTTFTSAALVENDYLTLVITAVGATPGKDANIICTVQ